MNAEKAKEIATKAKEQKDKEEYEKFLAEDLHKILKDIEAEASKGKFSISFNLPINKFCIKHLEELGFKYEYSPAYSSKSIISWR